MPQSFTLVHQINSCGSGHPITIFLLLPPIVLFSLVNLLSLEPRSFGRQERQANVSSLAGWLYMISVGQPIDENAIICSSCALCNQEPETISHLLVGCSFSREVWYRILLRGRWHSISPIHPGAIFSDWWLAARKRFGKVDRKSFDTLVLLAFWIIWKETEPANF